ncbi:hypothetical protein [Caenispirillum bisanense]|uniref:hypothetical protein n=1 Tax=Caenispirillum bisanense TaxID=414052 RepID=UPI0031DDFD0E
MSFDGNPLDIGIFLFAILVAATRSAVLVGLHGKACLSSKTVTNDILNATSLVPFVFMIGAIFSSDILKLALETQKVYMAIGGAIGAVAVLSALLKVPRAADSA